MAIQFTTGEISTYYRERVPNVKQQRARWWRGPCPIHQGTDNNFAVDSKSGVYRCHSGCGRGGDIFSLEAALTGADFPSSKAAVFALVGRNLDQPRNGTRKYEHSAQPSKGICESDPGHLSFQQRIECTYDYADASEKLLYQVVRLHSPKDFRQRYQSCPDKWCWEKHPQQVLYRLPEVLEASIVFLVEGEKDVETLRAWGFVATTNAGGAKAAWLPQFTEALRAREVILIPDHDKPGREHAAAVAAALLGEAASVKVVELPGSQEKGDITDWRDAGGTLEQLLSLTQAAQQIDVAALAALLTRWGLEGDTEQPAARTHAAEGWPKPEPIESELPPVMAFAEDLVPDSFRALVADVAERMQVPIDLPAVAAVLCLAGAVNRRAAIQPKANDTGWVVIPNLWGGFIAPPGFLKSPVIQAISRPLTQIQAEWRQEYEEALKNYAREKEECKLLREVWQTQFKDASKKGKTAPDRPENDSEEPKLRRIILNDATFEATHATMSENPAGIFMIRDELAGWLSQLDRPGREGERAFCLQAWNGDTGHTIDRIGRGTIHVPACCMSMLSGTQPGRFRTYLLDAIKDGPSNDGLIQRLQLMVWPDMSPNWKYVDRVPDAVPEEQVAQIFRRLVELDVETPKRYRFSPEAQELFVEWLPELEGEVRGDELHPALISHLAKYRSLMPSLALLFELASWAAGTGSGDLVSLKNTQLAAAWCDYLKSHSRRIYSCVVTPQQRAACELASKIRQRKVGKDGFFCRRDVYSKGWSGLDSPELAKLAVELLEEAGWVRDASNEAGPSGGRPSTRYAINPRVWE